ncbi:MAG: hypothetical protein JWQ71_772 [Pedosphaera sp.]|nr:hypothetical protein [Pedosphaera sp.]
MIWWKHARHNFSPFSFYKQKHRFNRWFPRAFLILACLALLGGILHAPANYDALAYRLPRILHWLAVDHWHWIHTEFNRLNTRAFGFEWLATPLLVFTRSDRPVFLINLISFLLLPGLCFSILTRLGVQRRAAWYWMWLLPTGYVFLLQAGSLGNDLFGVIFVLAAMDFVLRAWVSRSYSDIWLSILAAALFTGSKMNNLPLLLPWLIAFLPSLRLLASRIVITTGVCAVGVACSFLPMAAINYKYSGDWTGFTAEHLVPQSGAYGLHLVHNSVALVIQNLAPPIFPFAKAWNEAVIRHFPASLMARLESFFEPSQAHLALGEIAVEEFAGLGFGVSALILISLLARIVYSKKAVAVPPNFPGSNLVRWAILLSPFFSLSVYMVKSGLSGEARLVSSYYGLLVPVLLLGGAQACIVKARWWKICAAMVFLLAGLLVVISPARPLWPAQYLLARVHSNNPLVNRARLVYSVYSERADGFAPVRKVLPAGIDVLGMITADDLETSLWRPFGSRRIEHVTHTDTPEDLRRRGIHYVLISSQQFAVYFKGTVEEWLSNNHAELVQKFPLKLRAAQPPVDWLLVRINH